MEKELHEHPAVIGDTLHRMVNPATRAVALPASAVRLRHAAAHHHQRLRQRLSTPVWSARWWFEAIARIPTDADVASEFRYRTPPLAAGRAWRCWCRQSGETADTMAALRYMREQGAARAVDR